MGWNGMEIGVVCRLGLVGWIGVHGLDVGSLVVRIEIGR